MGGFLTDDDIERLRPASEAMFPPPIPTQVIASHEFWPIPKTERQKRVEARITDFAGELAARQGVPRRRCLQAAAGMAAAFVAMNDVHRPIFGVSSAEATEPERAEARAAQLRDQFVGDVRTHFLREDARIMTFVVRRRAVGRAGWNPALVGQEQTIDGLKHASWFRDVFLDSDTKVALISGAPSDDARDWFLTSDMQADACQRVNGAAGARRCLTHAIFTPGQPGWMDEVERAIAELRPDSWKGYTVGDNTNKQLSQYPCRMDDERVMYPFYDRILRAGHNIVCIHKGLHPPQVAERFPHLLPYAGVDDAGKAAKDWPQIVFVICHSGCRWAGGGNAGQGPEQFERTGRVERTSDLAEIPAQFSVSNVYGDLGQIFAQTTAVEPRLCAALMGILVNGLGHENVVRGTDAVWTGSPQWQAEALRRLEIPEDMRARHGFAPLGPADGPVKTAIVGGNSARMYRYDQLRAGLEADGVARVKTDYAAAGPGRGNLDYGYVTPG